MVEWTRRKFIGMTGLGVAAAGGYLAFQRYQAATNFGPAPEGVSELDWIADHLVDGGPPPDGIPPIEDPEYVTPRQAEERGWVRDGDVVDGFVAEGRAHALPRSITTWHEIVWTTVAGSAAAVTYCPLTGTTIGVRGETTDGRALTFGTSGKLYNNNLVMYDRQTGSLWPQMLLTAVKGPLKGETLDTFPVRTTTWKRWKDEHPDTRVLSRDTGHNRNYDDDPYEGYEDSPGTPFPNAADARNADVDLHPKALIFPVVTGGEQGLCAAKDRVRTKGALNVRDAGTPLALLHHPALDTMLAHRAEVDGRRLDFEPRGDRYVDDETGSTWTPDGRCVDGELQGRSLDRALSYEAFWFAWYAYNPGTRVLL